jgi:hypothetical protein
MNIENLRRTAKTGLHGNGSLRISGALGNTENFISDTSISNFFNTEDSEWLLFLNHRYGEAFSETNADRGKAHLRYTFKINPKWGYESFTQGEYDDFQRLTSRFIFGQALRFSAFSGKASSLYLGAGAFYEWEEVQNQEMSQSPIEIENFRANIYASFHLKVKERDTFFLTLYYQPFRADDFRVLSSAGYQIPLNKFFSLSLELNYNYDSRPPIGIERTDITYFTTLNYSY